MLDNFPVLHSENVDKRLAPILGVGGVVDAVVVYRHEIVFSNGALAGTAQGAVLDVLGKTVKETLIKPPQGRAVRR